jgi:hypothetical protein
MAKRPKRRGAGGKEREDNGINAGVNEERGISECVA